MRFADREIPEPPGRDHSRRIRHSGTWKLALVLLWLWSADARAQSPVIWNIINSVNLDSLTNTVKVLSGETGSKNGAASDTIYSRFEGTSTHDLAIDYLKGKLEGYGLSFRLLPFEKASWSGPGTNIVAEQKGATTPGRKYIVCSHYDCVSDSILLAPGADDDASGCAAVLETARILSGLKTEYTVIYAFWDQEEIGLRGSTSYADSVASQGDTILGVLNLDMIGWDGNNDNFVEIHASPVGHSWELASTVDEVSELYNLGLWIRVYLEGSTSSDHASFWNKGYSAVFLTEAYQTEDFNPFYHRRTDRVKQFNLSYFHRMARLAAGSTARLVNVQAPTSVPLNEPLVPAFRLEQNYPNPFNPKTEIRYSVAPAAPRDHASTEGRDGQPSGFSDVKITVYDLLGSEVAVLVDERKSEGSYQVTFDGTGLSGGVYFYRLTAGYFAETKRLLLLK